MAIHNDLGIWGEQVARDWLVARGYAIVEHDKEVAGAEIDLIATRGDRICFIEVKTRSTDFVDPLEAIDRRRRARMVRAADAFMRDYNIPLEPQFDFILIIGTPETGHTLEHIPDAFWPNL